MWQQASQSQYPFPVNSSLPSTNSLLNRHFRGSQAQIRNNSPVQFNPVAKQKFLEVNQQPTNSNVVPLKNYLSPQQKSCALYQFKQVSTQGQSNNQPLRTTNLIPAKTQAETLTKSIVSAKLLYLNSQGHNHMHSQPIQISNQNRETTLISESPVSSTLIKQTVQEQFKTFTNDKKLRDIEKENIQLKQRIQNMEELSRTSIQSTKMPEQKVCDGCTQQEVEISNIKEKYQDSQNQIELYTLKIDNYQQKISKIEEEKGTLRNQYEKVVSNLNAKTQELKKIQELLEFTQNNNKTLQDQLKEALQQKELRQLQETNRQLFLKIHLLEDEVHQLRTNRFNSDKRDQTSLNNSPRNSEFISALSKQDLEKIRSLTDMKF